MEKMKMELQFKDSTRVVVNMENSGTIPRYAMIAVKPNVLTN